MSDLVARTGVRPATIRHYLDLGLLPPAHQLAANRFLYDRRHEQALRMIRLLRERRHLPLAEIRRLLPSLSKMPEEQAFRPEMWDQVVEAQLGAGARRAPAARLLRAGMAAFARHGFAEVRVDDVCQSAKLAKGSFYRHYRSKEDLFFAAALAAGAEAGRAFTAAATATARAGPGPSGAGGDDGTEGGEAGGGGSQLGGGGLGPEEASAVLGRALTPHLPLVLDLLALAAQRRPGHARVAQALFADLHRVVRDGLDRPLAVEGERKVVGDALLLGIRHLMTDPEHGTIPRPS